MANIIRFSCSSALGASEEFFVYEMRKPAGRERTEGGAFIWALKELRNAFETSQLSTRRTLYDQRKKIVPTLTGGKFATSNRLLILINQQWSRANSTSNGFIYCCCRSPQKTTNYSNFIANPLVLSHYAWSRIKVTLNVSFARQSPLI